MQSVTRADASPTNASSVHFNVTFSEPVTGVDDYTGYDFWLRKLDSFAGDFRRAEMVKAFLSKRPDEKRGNSEAPSLLIRTSSAAF